MQSHRPTDDETTVYIMACREAAERAYGPEATPEDLFRHRYISEIEAEMARSRVDMEAKHP